MIIGSLRENLINSKNDDEHEFEFQKSRFCVGLGGDYFSERLVTVQGIKMA
jgi:hypothetical protein